MSYEITGKICHIGETIAVTDKFRKREFVLEITEEFNGQSYTSYAKLQTVQNKCAIIEQFDLGDTVTANFNVKGNKYADKQTGEIKYLTNLDCWAIKAGTAIPENVQQPKGTGNFVPSPENVDDLPF